MIRYFKLLFTVALVGTVGSCSAKPVSKSANSEEKKAIVIYFTHSGNTELAARNLAEHLGCEAIRLMPEQPYSSEDVDWTDDSSRCTREHLDQSLRPAIRPLDIDFGEVSTVFIGFPIWWHEEPAVIRTFLDVYGEQLRDKAIYPFCTSYESPMAEADATLAKGFPTLTLKKGLRFPADSSAIEEWLNQ